MLLSAHPEMSMPEDNTKIADEEHVAVIRLRRELAASGFTWVFLSSLLVLSSLSFYHISYYQEAFDTSLIQTAISITLLIIASVIYYISRQSKREFVLWHICIMLLTAFWLSVAFDIYMAWYDSTAAESVLMIAFFVFILGFHTQPSMLALSLPFLVIGSMYFMMASENYAGPGDLVVSFVIYPVFYLFFRQTISKFYRQAKEKYIENIHLIERLKEVSITDELTGIGNRKAFNQWLEMSIALIQRQKTNLSLVILDIDFFKQYNDTFGHPVGDQCIRQVAQILKEKCRRQSDRVCRIGGEEFALILPDSDAIQAAQLVQTIMRELATSNIIHPNSTVADRLTLSFGIAQYHKQEVEELYKQADQALYDAKHSGRNQFAIAS